ncbi:MAG: carboxypeptidase regulatory-like domain-containing protein [Vicinamibacteria bacterium]
MTRPFRSASRALSLATSLGLAVAFSVSLTPTAAYAQIDAGSVVGTVSDGQGGVLPGASVTATQDGTGFSLTSTTNSQGQFNFPNLKIGKYTLTAEISGFKKSIRSGLQLHVQERIQVDFKLEVGAMTEEVTVSGEAPLLNTQSGDMGYVVDQKQLTDLPLLGRRYAELALLQTGVVPGGRQLASLGEDTTFNANGNFGTWNNYQLDGADNNSGSTNLQERSAQVVQPPVDALEEFRIQTRTYSAEFGKSAGAVINASIKQGSNKYKGTLFGFLRDEKFNANTFENIAAGRVKPQYNQYIGGFTLGGPIKKDKIFIFGDYQVTRSDRAVTDLATVPTAQMRTGNLSELSTGFTASNPYVPAGCINAATKTISPACFDPIAAKLINLYPLPNYAPGRVNEGKPGGFGAANYISNGVLQNDVNSFDVRVDAKPDTKQSLFVRYSRYRNTRNEPPVLGPIVSGDFNSDIFITGQSGVLGWSRSINQSMFSEVRIGWNKIQGDTLHKAFGIDSNKEYGITGIPTDPRYTGGLAAFNIAGISRIGGPSFRPQFQTSQIFQISANTTWQKGNHSMKFGAEVRRDKVKYIDLTALNGAATFSNGRYSGTGVGDFLLGLASGQRVTLFHEAKLYSDGIQLFAQDSWRPTSKLAINYGVRYEFFTPPIDEDNALTNIDAATGARIVAKSGSLYDRTLIHPDKNNIAPRVSVSYSATDKLVMRGGFGTFYQNSDRYGSEAQMALNPPQLIDVNVNAANATVAPVLILRNGFTTPTLANINPTLLQWRIQDPNQKTPIVYQFSAGPEYQLFSDTVVSAEYVGNIVRNGRRLRNLNQGRITGPSTVVFPYAQYGYGTAYLEQIVTVGRSAYHALQTKVQRRMHGGLGYTASYTYSVAKSDFLDHLSAGLGASGNIPQNAYDLGADYGPVAFDVPHRFVLSFVAELPAGRGRKTELHGVAGALLNNWSVNGILSLNSGRPFTATATDVSNTGTGHQSRANCAGDAQPSGFDSTPAKWFDTTQFSQPAAFTFGTCGSNTLRGPGQKNFNASLFRTFPLSGDRRIEFRAEAFNVFNWKNYALPGTSVATPATFGVITSTLGDVRELQFAVKLYF